MVKAHGLKGEVSVAPAVGLPFVLREGLEVWFVPPPATARSARVISLRPGPKGPLVGFDTIPDIEAASALTGAQIMARAADVPAVFAEEPFDAVGVRVSDTERGFLGEISEIIETGANDVWVVEGGPYGQVLVPVIDQVVIDLDETEGAALVRLLPGLLPEDAEEA